jgi:hypothetical protein
LHILNRHVPDFEPTSLQTSGVAKKRNFLLVALAIIRSLCQAESVKLRHQIAFRQFFEHFSLVGNLHCQPSILAYPGINGFGRNRLCTLQIRVVTSRLMISSYHIVHYELWVKHSRFLFFV